MFVIVGSVNYKEHLEDYDRMPPSYSEPMHPELYMDKDVAEQRLFQRVIELPDKYNSNLHRVKNYEGTYNTVLLDEHGKIKCFYGYDQDYEKPFGYVETKELYVSYELLEI